MGLVERVVFRVEPEDEINEVIRKVCEAEERQIVLILPERPRLLRNEVNMRLLSGYARSEDKELVLVTDDRVVCRLADLNGIPTSPTLPSLYENEGVVLDPNDGDPVVENAWSSSKTRGERVALRRAVKVDRSSMLARTGVIALALSVTIGLWYLFSPKMTIYVEPAVSTIAETLTLRASENVEAADVVPAVQESFPVDGQVTIASTGVRIEGVSKAQGTVVFVNEGSSPVKVPKGTILGTASGEEFLTLEGITVPAVEVEYLMNISVGRKAGTAEVDIEAVHAGERGNVSKGTITGLKGEWKNLQVTNPEPTRGGMDRRLTVVSSEDIERAKEMLKEQLMRQASHAASRGSDGMLVQESISLIDVSFEDMPKVGQELPRFTVLASGRAKALVIDTKELEKAIVEKLRERVPSGFSLGEAVTVGQMSFVKEEGVWVGTVPVTAEIRGIIDESFILERVAGLGLAEAIQVIRETAPVSDVRFSREADTIPTWSPWTRIVVAPVQ